MGMYDIVLVRCPQCGTLAEFQSKSGRCILKTYSLDEAPDDVLLDVNRHAPITCAKCAARFGVEIFARGGTAAVREIRAWAMKPAKFSLERYTTA